jgi:hypothetical protein
MGAILTFALGLLNTVLAGISTIKAQAGLSDDEILAAAEAQVGTNSATYAALEAHLAASATPPPAQPAPAPAPAVAQDVAKTGDK